MADTEYSRMRTTTPPPPHIEETTEIENGDSDTHHSAGQQKTSTSSQYFTLDDVPPSKYRDRFLEFKAWIHSQMLLLGANLKNVLDNFLARMIGKLSNWYGTLNVYAKAQLMEAHSIDEFLGLLHYEFLGKWEDDMEIARKEFYQMKCYSLKIRDLDVHL